MTRAIAPAIAALLALSSPLPALAQDPAPADEGVTLQELREKTERALELFADKAGDILEKLGAGAEEISRYGAPRMLPNGDILIPRLPDPDPEAAPDAAPAPPQAEEDGSISL